MSPVTVRIDLHVHSEASYDGHEPVELLVEHAAAIGLDAIVITDHDTTGGSVRAAELAADYGLIGIPGVEVSTAHGHLLAIGVERMPPRQAPYTETIAWIHDHGGIAVVPHPFQRSRHGVRRRHVPVPDSAGAGGTDASDEHPGTGQRDELHEVDAIEVFNAWLFTGYRNRRARRFATKHGYPGVAASDAHTLKYVGRAFTELSIDGRESVGEVTAEDVLSAIREGTTTVNGRRAPVTMAATHYVVAAVRKTGYYVHAGRRYGAERVHTAVRETGSIAHVLASRVGRRIRRIRSWIR